MLLLSFMLAFTFNSAAGRHDVRKGLVIEETNAINRTWLRAGILQRAHPSLSPPACRRVERDAEIAQPLAQGIFLDVSCSIGDCSPWCAFLMERVACELLADVLLTRGVILLEIGIMLCEAVARMGTHRRSTLGCVAQVVDTR